MECGMWGVEAKVRVVNGKQKYPNVVRVGYEDVERQDHATNVRTGMPQVQKMKGKSGKCTDGQTISPRLISRRGCE